jgi:hypothetical protein
MSTIVKVPQKQSNCNNEIGMKAFLPHIYWLFSL